MKLKKLFGLANIASASTVLLIACGSSSSSSSSDDTTFRIGIITLDDATELLWGKAKELTEDKGVRTELAEFTGYNQSSEALRNDEINVNTLQYKYFSSNWSSENDGTLVEVADILLSPIRLFSGTNSNGDIRCTDVNDIPDKGTISIPSDASNGSCALYLLQSAGLIELDASDNELATTRNISSNPKSLDIKEVDTVQTAPTLASIDATITNNSYVQPADIDYGIAPYKEAVDENSNQWINVIVAQKGWKKLNRVDTIKTLISVYQTDEVGKIIEEASEDADIPAQDSATTSSSSPDND